MTLRPLPWLAGIALLTCLPGGLRAQEVAEASPERVWARAEYLLMWTKGATFPPLVTTGPLNVLGPRGRPGTLGLPGTQTLIGDTAEFGPSSGARFVLGGWLDDEATLGLEGGYFFLAERSLQRAFAEPGTPGSRALALPFQDAQLGGVETTTGIAFPRPMNPFSGAASLTGTTRLQGWEASGIYGLGQMGGVRLQALAGYRFLALDEGLHFSTSSQNVPPLPADIFRTTDSFRTSNDFHGGQVGLRGEVDLGPVALRATGKVALGTMHEVTHIAGDLVTNDFTNLGPVQVFRGGYFTQPTNIGRHTRNRFAVIPEVGLTAGWEPVGGVRLTAGYSFLYLSSVARPGDQIDRVLNASQNPSFFSDTRQVLVGPARPAFLGRDSDYWAHGLSLGLELRF